MVFRMSQEKIIDMLLNQIRNHYFESDKDRELIEKYFPVVMERVERNFSKQTNKYYSRCTVPGDESTRETFFNPLHSCQWLMFLYYAANTIFKADKSAEAIELCDKVYGLSKVFSGAELYYEIELPEVFYCDHPIGTVLGRAVYGNNFSFLHGCTVGNNHGIYPVLGENVRMMSDSKVVGKCTVGNNVIISANTYIKDQDVPDNVIVFGHSPNLTFKRNKHAD